eukprot:1156285-Pelagomonas_calceolata.AAC.3
MSLPHQVVRGKLLWVWWVSGSMRPQGTRDVLSVFDFNGTSSYLDMAVLDVRNMKLPGWSCAASYFFIKSQTAEYPMAMSDQGGIRAAGGACSLIRNAGVKELPEVHLHCVPALPLMIRWPDLPTAWEDTMWWDNLGNLSPRSDPRAQEVVDVSMRKTLGLRKSESAYSVCHRWCGVCTAIAEHEQGVRQHVRGEEWACEGSVDSHRCMSSKRAVTEALASLFSCCYTLPPGLPPAEAGRSERPDRMGARAVERIWHQCQSGAVWGLVLSSPEPHPQSGAMLPCVAWDQGHLQQVRLLTVDAVT